MPNFILQENMADIEATRKSTAALDSVQINCDFSNVQKILCIISTKFN